MDSPGPFLWFEQLYRYMLIEDIEKQLPGLKSPSDFSHDKLGENERRKLILAASALSLSENPKERKKAYEIASRLLEIEGGDNNLVAAADIIFSRLGNFPGRALLRQMYPGTKVAPNLLSLERLAREFENTIDLGFDRDACLTDFQFKLFEALGESKSFSVSAPTSAGKSFVLGLDLVRRLQRRQESVVYLVPTRALIREVANNVRSRLRDSGLDVPVRTVPFPLPREKCPQGLVYVLTQERLMSLLAADNEGVWISTLFVDEAHNIQDGVRGIVLQNAIERVSRKFPEAEIHFASPMSSNPQILLQIASRPTLNATLVENLSPVAQNIILVREIKGKTNSARFALMNGLEEIDMGLRLLPFKLRGETAAQKAALARSITGEDEATIVFTNDASSAEKVARAICDLSTMLRSTSRSIEELIEFIRSEVHPRYPLIECLPHGVAYHYGDMPPLVRARVEDLFKSGEIRFICCTSTLLQGVNLPARHIIIEDPRRGTSGPMPRRDFLNLAGRAGRLLKEFHGNIWCLRPESWADPVYKGPELTAISSTIEDAMRDGGTLVQKATNDEPIKEKLRELGEAVLGKLFLEKTRDGESFSLEQWKTAENEEALSATRKRLDAISVTLPLYILEDNSGIRPDRLQSLYDYLKELDLDGIYQWIPLNPWAHGYYDRMEKIIKLLELTLRGRDNNSYTFYAWLAAKWIHGVPLGEIIISRVDSDLDSEKLSTEIRNLLKSLESEIRFRLVKHYLAFYSIIKLILEQKGQHKLSSVIEPFHVYLECGAASPSLLNMIALGLSRSTAIATDRCARLKGKANTPEDMLRELLQLDFDSLEIPSLCKRELNELAGRK